MPVTASKVRRKTWAQSDGAGRDSSVWGITGLKGQVLALMGTLVLMIGAPAFVTVV